MNRHLYIGAIIEESGRGGHVHRYAVFDAVPYVSRRTGEETTLYQIVGLCATCGDPFALTIVPGTKWIARNCLAHRPRRDRPRFSSPEAAREYDAALLHLRGRAQGKTKRGPAVGAMHGAPKPAAVSTELKRAGWVAEFGPRALDDLFEL